MLRNIPWSNFLSILAILTIGYYLIIGLVYYRSSIRAIFRRGRRLPNAASDQSGAQEQLDPADVRDDFASTKEAIDKLKSVIERATADGVDRQDLLHVVSFHLEPYKILHGTAFGVAINNSITRECDQYGHNLSEDELDAIWSSK
jgi:hypothetical protein